MSALYRPCVSDSKPVPGGTYLYDRGPNHTPRYHQGIDIGIPVGTPLYASGDGRVTYASATPHGSGHTGGGWYVTIAYGEYTVTTMHHSAVSVIAGELVNVETQIGLSGGRAGADGSGDATGPHVHIQTTDNGRLIDPASILNSRSAIASDVITPINPEDEMLDAMYFIASSNNPTVTVGVGDVWVRPHVTDILHRLTSEQAQEQFALFGLDYNSPNVKSVTGAQLDTMFAEDKVAAQYTAKVHPA